jgi:hypothetical protein
VNGVADIVLPGPPTDVKSDRSRYLATTKRPNVAARELFEKDPKAALKVP